MTCSVGFRFPVSLDLTGRRCVVVGGGAQALDKVRALLDAAAHVVVISYQPTGELVDLAEHERICLVRRPYRRGDLAGAWLVIVSGEDRPTPTREIWDDAERERTLMLAVDDPAHCHLAAMSVVRRGDLRIAISTAGKAPALAKRIRQQLEQQFGPEWGELVEVVHRTRRTARPRSVGFGEWARRWQTALADHEALTEKLAAGHHREVRGRLQRAVGGEPTAAGGRLSPADHATGPLPDCYPCSAGLEQPH